MKALLDTMRRYIDRAQMHALHRRSLRTIERFQDKHLRAIVSYAHKNVPLYKELLKKASVRPEEIRTRADLARLPIIDKRTFRGKPVEEYVDNSRPLFVAWKKTSGTTGVPFSSIPGLSGLPDYSDFMCFRFLMWKGVRLKDIKTTRIARIKMSPDPRPNRLSIATRDFLADPARGMRTLAEFKPEIVETFPSIALEIARVVAEGRASAMPHIPYIVVYGEVLTPRTRAFIESTLGTEVYDRYGLEETGVVGTECAKHDGFHTTSEVLVVEIVDEKGRLVPDGRYGRIILTDLMNRNMPLIRYETGDEGKITREPCGCGLRSPRVFVRGRRYGGYITMCGRRILDLEFDVAFGDLGDAVLQYQVAKRSERDLLIRIVPTPAFRDHTAEAIKVALRSALRIDARITIERVAAIPRQPTGKSLTLIDESTDATSR